MDDLSDVLLGIMIAAFLGHVFTLLRWRRGWNQSNLVPKDPNSESKTQATAFEVVVPVRNEAQRIGTLLDLSLIHI